jgi:hypothetical protein
MSIRDFPDPSGLLQPVSGVVGQKPTISGRGVRVGLRVGVNVDVTVAVTAGLGVLVGVGAEGSGVQVVPVHPSTESQVWQASQLGGGPPTQVPAPSH